MPEKSDKLAHSIPPLVDWPTGPSGWLRAFGSLDYAQAFGVLFWPKFVRHDGCTFLRVPDEKNYAGWVAQLKGDRTRVEATMNHRHICDLLPCSEHETAREHIVTVGKLLRETWSAKLRSDFPEERFTVRFSEDYEEDLVDYYITFFHNTDPGN